MNNADEFNFEVFSANAKISPCDTDIVKSYLAFLALLCQRCPEGNIMASLPLCLKIFLKKY